MFFSHKPARERLEALGPEHTSFGANSVCHSVVCKCVVCKWCRQMYARTSVRSSPKGFVTKHFALLYEGNERGICHVTNAHPKAVLGLRY